MPGGFRPCGACGKYVSEEDGCKHWRPKLNRTKTDRERLARWRAGLSPEQQEAQREKKRLESQRRRDRARAMIDELEASTGVSYLCGCPADAVGKT